jgi:predicted RNA-binding protein
VQVQMVIAQQSVRGGQNVIVFGSELSCDGVIAMRGRTMVAAPAPTQEGAR